MRLKQHLNEITKVPDEEIREILDKSFAIFEKKKKPLLWPMLLTKLDLAFANYNIIFFRDKDMFGKELLNGKKGTTVLEKGLPQIAISLTKEDIKGLKSRSGIEKIKNKVFKVILHEIIHRKQNQRKSGEYIDYMYANIGKFKAALSNQNLADYMSDKEEIEAFARQAVFNLEQKNTESEIINSYFQIGGDTWKRFLKKLYQYLDMYGTDIGKEELEMKMKTIKKL